MGRASEKTRGERLDQLVGLLRSSDSTTTGELANQLNVSHRTLMRDLELLRLKDLPIESDRGRGGGVRLASRWGVGRLALDYRETIGLLVGLAIMQRIGSPLFLENLASVRRKLATSFADSQRSKIAGLRRRLLVGELASPQVLATYTPPSARLVPAIHEAFFDMRVLHITYEDERAQLTTRSIEPHYLFLNWPVWYILAWDHLRQDVRFFRLDRLLSARLDGSAFRPRPAQPFLMLVETISAPV